MEEIEKIDHIGIYSEASSLRSIAISLKRIADILESGGFPQQIQMAIQEAIWNATKKG